MDLQLYVENLRRQFAAAAEVGGADVRALAERLITPLDAAIRLTLQDVLAVAAEEITCELAPGSVELRLHGREPEFVVTPPPGPAAGQEPAADAETAPDGWAAGAGAEAGDGEMTRINLRMPELFKARIERAAGRDGLSVNAWLVRAAGAALERAEPGRHGESRTPRGAQRYTGWVQ